MLYGGRAIHGPCRLWRSEPKPRFGSIATPASGWPMPVLPRRRHEIGEPVEKLKRREFDDAVGSRPRGLPPTAPPDPVGRLVSRQHVADASDPAVRAADHGQPFEREGRSCTVSAPPPERSSGLCAAALRVRRPSLRLGRRPREMRCPATAAAPEAIKKSVVDSRLAGCEPDFDEAIERHVRNGCCHAPVVLARTAI